MKQVPALLWMKRNDGDIVFGKVEDEMVKGEMRRQYLRVSYRRHDVVLRRCKNTRGVFYMEMVGMFLGKQETYT